MGMRGMEWECGCRKSMWEWRESGWKCKYKRRNDVE